MYKIDYHLTSLQDCLFHRFANVHERPIFQGILLRIRSQIERSPSNSAKSSAIGLCLLLAYFISPIILRRQIVDKAGNHMPPGPAIRYAFLRKYAERALHAWAKEYGELFSIWMGSQLFVVVSDPHVARDLLVTNGAIFSTRKRYFMKNQVILRGRAITASEYGNKWYESHLYYLSDFYLLVHAGDSTADLPV